MKILEDLFYLTIGAICYLGMAGFIIGVWYGLYHLLMLATGWGGFF